MSEDELHLFGEAGGPSRPRERKPREADPLFDALAFSCGVKPADLTASGRGMMVRALKELRDAGATPPELLHRAQAYRERFSGTPTPGALARHWAALSERPRAAKRHAAPVEAEPVAYLERSELAARARAFRKDHS